MDSNSIITASGLDLACTKLHLSLCQQDGADCQTPKITRNWFGEHNVIFFLGFLIVLTLMS